MTEYRAVSKAAGDIVGAVPPMARPDDVPVLVDNSLADFDSVIIGSRVLGYALSLMQCRLIKSVNR